MRGPILCGILASVLLVLSFAIDDWDSDKGPRIGATEVPPDLACEEDSVIGFVQAGEPPYRLGCLHIDGGDGWGGN